MNTKQLCLAAVLTAAAAAWGRASEFDPDQSTTSRELAQIIDRLLARSWTEDAVTPAPPADDAEFGRRLHLDLIGRIPSVFEARSFIDDPSPAKRGALLERLLADPEYINHASRDWARLLIPQAESDAQLRQDMPVFESWLRTRLADNMGFDQLVRELLGASLEESAISATEATPILFFVARQSKPELLAASTSRLFLGVRLECAQCHDHPFDVWKQNQFWSMAAFFAGVEPSAADQPLSMPREIRRRIDIQIPSSKKFVQPAFLDGVQPRWRYDQSPRASLVEWLTSPKNPYFAKAVVNRVWKRFFGVGLVEPVDEMGPSNPPSHPELLDALAGAFVASGFNVKFIVRAIVQSRAYQSSSRLTNERQDLVEAFARMTVRGMSADQLYDSIAQATGGRFEPVTTTATLSPAKSEFQALFADFSSNSIERQTSILQALTMMNGPMISGALDPKSKGTLGAVLEFPLFGVKDRIETLYLAALGRRPTAIEMKEGLQYVENSGPNGQAKALSDLFWALLNSPEFLFNH